MEQRWQFQFCYKLDLIIFVLAQVVFVWFALRAMDGYFFVAWADIPKRFPSQLCQFQLRKYGITSRLADQTIVIYQIGGRCELGLLIRHWSVQVHGLIEI